MRMKIISLIFIRFSYVSLIRNSVTGPLDLHVYKLVFSSFPAVRLLSVELNHGVI